MSTLVLDELYPNVKFSQTIRIKKNTSIAHIRPWIYKHGTLATGDLVCRIKDGVTTLKTVSINYVDINAEIPSAYSHGFIRFDIYPFVLLLDNNTIDKDYVIEFEMINYIKDINGFIGICRSFENEIYELHEASPNSMVRPAGIEIYQFKENL